MSKTIKQIADEIGVSKTAVRKQIENLGLRSSLRKNGNQFAIDKHEETLILKAFSEKTQTKNANQNANRKPRSFRFSLRFAENNRHAAGAARNKGQADRGFI